MLLSLRRIANALTRIAKALETIAAGMSFRDDDATLVITLLPPTPKE